MPAKLFPFLPDWAEPVDYTESFLTEVIKSRDNTEQRRAVRFNPRKTFNFRVSERGAGKRRLRAYLERFIQSEFELPDPVRRVSVAPAGAGESVLILSEAKAWAQPGIIGYVRFSGVWERVAVDGVVGATLVLSKPLSQDIPYPAVFFMAHTGRLAQNSTQSVPVSDAVVSNIEFLVTPNGVPPREGDPQETFNGRELFLMKPNWATAPSVSVAGGLETADAGFGVSRFSAHLLWNRKTTTMTYLGRGQAEVDSVLEFFRRNKGRRGDFYMPTWENDIPLENPVVGAALVIPGTEFHELYSGKNPYKAVMAFYYDGTHEAHTVEQITEDGTNTTVAFGGAWTKATNSLTVAKLCWLPVCRFASDEIVVEWMTDEVAQWRSSFEILEPRA